MWSQENEQIREKTFESTSEWQKRGGGKPALRKLGKSIQDDGNYKQRTQTGKNLMGSRTEKRPLWPEGRKQDCSQINLLSCVYLPSLAQKTTNNSIVYKIWLLPALATFYYWAPGCLPVLCWVNTCMSCFPKKVAIFSKTVTTAGYISICSMPNTAESEVSLKF